MNVSLIVLRRAGKSKGMNIEREICEFDREQFQRDKFLKRSAPNCRGQVRPLRSNPLELRNEVHPPSTAPTALVNAVSGTKHRTCQAKPWSGNLGAAQIILAEGADAAEAFKSNINRTSTPMLQAIANCFFSGRLGHCNLTQVN